ncbi:hypothetical protein BS78_09G175200 [Paspalum vaginatum]|nr:hypothetical protein BS78_09G175200 [Paspalum vaginatum]
MHRLSALPFPLCFMASATTSLWLPALSRRVFPIMMSPICNPLPRLCVSHDTIPPVHRLFRFPRRPRNMATISRAESDEFGKPYRRVPISSADVISPPLDNNEKSGAILDVIAGDDTTDKDACWNTSEVIYIEHDTWGQTAKHAGSDGDEKRETEDHRKIVVSDDEEYTVDNILAESRHCDGSIYRGMNTWWKQMYNIADRNETRLQAMALSYPTDCIIHDGICVRHQPRCMLQILSLELAKIPVDGGFVELYGYIAVRDDLDLLLNFIVNISRDEPIIVEQGSLINMVGPKRGIDIMDQALIEYDMRIKAGEQEKDDLQLIDGASIIGPAVFWNCPLTFRIASDSGAVGLTLSYLQAAVEATLEVFILEARSSFNLSLGCLTSGLNKEIWLFDGAIAESCFLKRYVVAVLKDSLIVLKFKLGSLLSGSDQHCCSFESKTHGHDTLEIKTDFALFSVKVTWSTLPNVI